MIASGKGLCRCLCSHAGDPTLYVVKRAELHDCQYTTRGSRWFRLAYPQIALGSVRRRRPHTMPGGQSKSRVHPFIDKEAAKCRRIYSVGAVCIRLRPRTTHNPYTRWGYICLERGPDSRSQPPPPTSTPGRACPSLLTACRPPLVSYHPLSSTFMTLSKHVVDAW